MCPRKHPERRTAREREREREREVRARVGENKGISTETDVPKATRTKNVEQWGEK